MADDIRLVIGVEQKDLLKAITNTESLEGKVKKLSSVYARQSTALNKQSSEYKRYNKAITKLAKDTNYSKKELLDYGKALRADEKATNKVREEKKKAAKAVRDLAAEERKAAKAVEKEAASLRSLRMATDSVYRNQQKTLQMKKLLKSAIAAKTMTTEQAIVALKKFRAAQTSSNAAMSAGRNRMNGNNMAIQQLGYQFGDFAVQVQGGTSAFVAFSQQGAQLAGILPMIAGPLGLSMGAAVGLSAALGILIPIGSAIGRMFFEMSNETRSLNDIVSDLEKSTGSLFSSLSNIQSDSLEQTFGDLTEDIVRMETAMVSLEATAANLNLSAAVESLNGVTTAGFWKQVLEGGLNLGRIINPLAGDGTGLFGQMTPEDVDEEKFAKLGLDMSRAVFVSYMQNLQALAAEGDTEGVVKQFTTMFEDAADGSEGLTLKGVELLRTLQSAALASARMTAEMNGSAEAARLLANGSEQSEASLQEMARQERQRERDASIVNQLHQVRQENQEQAAENRIESLEEEASIQSFINGLKQDDSYQANLFGESLEDQERLNKLREFHNSLIEQGIKYGSYEYLQAVKYYQQIQINVAMVATFAENITKAAAAQQLLSNVSEKYETQLLIVNAQIKALQEGKNVEVAAFIEGERIKITALYETSRALNTQTGDIIALAEASLIFVEAMGSLDALAAAKAKLSDLKGDLNGGSKGVNEDAFEKLTKELSRRKELLSLSKERAVVTRAIWSLEDSLGKSRAKYSAEEIKALVEKNIALKKTEDALEAARSKQESLAESIASSMGDALMGIVDGTMTVKDAFRSMARDIIKQLYQVIVVQRLVGSAEAGKESGLAGFIIKGLSSINANGNVFSGGSQIQAYANGGVVGGPTTFPMAGGKTGLMGEAGPEAIMPLKRGSNGKLGVQMEGGGGQNVVINQSFNFQANGDDTVKKLIAQAAPKIAQMTKSSLLDDRRRGGSTKAAFG